VFKEASYTAIVNAMTNAMAMFSKVAEEKSSSLDTVSSEKKKLPFPPQYTAHQSRRYFDAFLFSTWVIDLDHCF
jgi:hypothetical protein